jgi:glycerol-3-phosphate acyltransferase PlsY
MAKVANVSSLAALISMSLAPLYIWLLWPAPELIVMQILITLLLIWRHRSNIEKLLKGDEGPISTSSTD